jgi:phenylacetic acid degradation operon negative regulatory protein
MVESFLLGGRVIRELVLDPLLPEPLLPTRERRALLDATRSYDQLGRRAWAAFMASHGAPHSSAPTNGSAGADLHRGMDSAQQEIDRRWRTQAP